MRVRLGNVAAKQGRARTIDARATRADLLRQAATAGVLVEDEPDDDLLRARLEATLEWEALPGNRLTTVHVPDGTSLAQAFVTITNTNGVWDHHSDAAPAWVESDTPALAQLLAAHFECAVRDASHGAGDDEGLTFCGYCDAFTSFTAGDPNTCDECGSVG